jgi:hypothetical protein
MWVILIIAALILFVLSLRKGTRGTATGVTLALVSAIFALVGTLLAVMEKQ